MIRLEKLQILGPVAVLIAVGAAEGSVWGLAHFPASEIFWYLNLKIFRIFQQSYYMLQISSYFDIPYAQFLLIALPLFAISAYGLLARQKFLLALASNLSFVYAAFLLYVGIGSQPHALAASLTIVSVSTGPNLFLPLALVGASLISFLVSHFQYLLGIIYSESSSRKLMLGISANHSFQRATGTSSGLNRLNFITTVLVAAP